MVVLAELWSPIVVAAAFVWLAAGLIWMVLPHHRSD